MSTCVPPNHDKMIVASTVKVTRKSPYPTESQIAQMMNIIEAAMTATMPIMARSSFVALSMCVGPRSGVVYREMRGPPQRHHPPRNFKAI
jgi:hypothetical protein